MPAHERLAFRFYVLFSTIQPSKKGDGALLLPCHEFGLHFGRIPLQTYL